MDEQFILIDAIKNINLGIRVQRKLKDLTEKKMTETKNRKVHPRLLQKNRCFVNKTTQKIRETSNTSNPNFNADIPQWSEASSGEEEYTGIRKGRIISNVDTVKSFNLRCTLIPKLIFLISYN